MKASICLTVLLSAITISFAGDGADGPNRYEADLTRIHTQEKMGKDDYRWAASLLKNLQEEGKPIYFTRTDLPLQKDGVEIQGLVYRRVDQSKYYYIAEGDVMLDLKEGRIYNPGVGGFSMHSPNNRNFIVCLNFQRGGVPFVRHSKIGQSKVWWFANEKWKRLENWQ